MNLGTKLLAAPLLTAALVLSVGAVGTVMQGRAAEHNRTSFKNDMENFRTLASVQDRLAQAHAGVYRTVALMASLDDAKVKALRAALAKQLDDLKQSLAALSAAGVAHPEFNAGVAALLQQVEKYGTQADAAIDLATVDPNTGIAAMQNADAAFAAAATAVGGLVAKMESGTAQAMDEAAARATRNSIALGLL